ncbi:hypothetical protein ASE63_06995 [Bosea sp. Root381]|uniref:hypothetical protein n=1 Tax=Bosea sp. Root381 TaxID=1736524 RepID=UPI0006F4E9D5|nr:hypothetical protein [Bosea sp. Root381]KRE02115.1 hypothetical protein ASE63_06995 [Bosea sp. Root381]
MTTRRNLLSLGLSGAALALVPLHARDAQAQGRAIGAIRVDTTRIAAQGWGENAQLIRVAMERQLATTLGPLYRRGAGATLLVTVKGVWLSSYAGGSGGGKPSGGGGSNDNFDSDVAVLGPRGQVLQSFPVLSVVDASSGGAWYRPDVDQRRVAALIENNALWIKRYLGG